MTSFFDFLISPKPKKSDNPDDIFIQSMRQHNDIWQSATASEDRIICCPVSASLAGDITREDLYRHILIPDRSDGEFITLHGERVVFSGGDLVVNQSKRVRVLSVENLPNAFGQTIYRISQPLLGGSAAPDEYDEISATMMKKYIVAIRSYPEAESILLDLDEYLSEVKVQGKPSGTNKLSL